MGEYPWDMYKFSPGIPVASDWDSPYLLWYWYKLLKFSRFSPLGEVKDLTDPDDIKNIQKKKKRGVTGYNHYDLIYNGEQWDVLLEIYKNRSESVYSIMRKKEQS